MCRNFFPPLPNPHRHTHTALPSVLFDFLCSNKCLLFSEPGPTIEKSQKHLTQNIDILQMIPVESILRSLPYCHMWEVNLEWSNKLCGFKKQNKIRQASAQRVGTTKPFSRESVSLSLISTHLKLHTSLKIKIRHKQSECFDKTWV